VQRPCHIAVRGGGDRFLIYTDGLIEPENAHEESFGDQQLEQVVRNNRSQPASELLQPLLFELCKWQPVAASQQDDITVIVVDVL
jgi:phosphoserine phosphatase RsbU/P